MLMAAAATLLLKMRQAHSSLGLLQESAA